MRCYFSNANEEDAKNFEKYKRETDKIFKHDPTCEWPYKYTKTEFEAFHRNKRVWEHHIDYYTIDGDYQRYEYYSKSLGSAEGIKKLANFTGGLDIETMDTFEESLRKPTICRRTAIETISRENERKSQSEESAENEIQNKK